jgi:hypothetical protein
MWEKLIVDAVEYMVLVATNVVAIRGPEGAAMVPFEALTGGNTEPGASDIAAYIRRVTQ